jgi:hypothetical protein
MIQHPREHAAEPRTALLFGGHYIPRHAHMIVVGACVERERTLPLL